MKESVNDKRLSLMLTYDKYKRKDNSCLRYRPLLDYIIPSSTKAAQRKIEHVALDINKQRKFYNNTRAIPQRKYLIRIRKSVTRLIQAPKRTLDLTKHSTVQMSFTKIEASKESLKQSASKTVKNLLRTKILGKENTKFVMKGCGISPIAASVRKIPHINNECPLPKFFRNLKLKNAHRIQHRKVNRAVGNDSPLKLCPFTSFKTNCPDC